MKKTLIAIIILVVLPFVLAPEESKIVYIPDNITVEKSASKVTTVLNLSEIGIYRTSPICVIDDFIYLTDAANCRVIKLTPQGKVLRQFGKKGEGPGEFLTIYGVYRFNENIAVVGKQKVVICTKDLQYLREKKMTEIFHALILSIDKKIYFYNNPSFFNHYFTVYTEDFQFLKKFGIKNPNAEDMVAPDKNNPYSFDQIRKSSYVPEENGIWVSFQDRYDIRYYKNEKTVVDIKSKNRVFSTKEEVFSGQKVMIYDTDYSLLIEKYKNRLYYCFRKGDNLFCDVFDLSDNYRLIRRIQFPFIYRQLVLFNESVFYGLRSDKDEENVLLDKIQIN